LVQGFRFHERPDISGWIDMTQAITARRDGDAFQSRLFWLKAASLLSPDSSVLKVGFEAGPKGFDDIWVEYDPQRAPQNQFGESLNKEFLQCKWHVKPGSYTHDDLARPEFINASSKSLLQRAHDAFKLHQVLPARICYRLITNWSPDERLARLIKTRSNTLRIDELFQGRTDRGANGKVRKLWREHLAIDDLELRAFAPTLGFSRIFESLDELRERLDTVCGASGLRRIPTEGSAVIYDDIVRQWASQNRNSFDRDSFRKACAQENLLAPANPRKTSYGVKSFEHPIDRLEDRCTEVLNLVPEFDERFIRDSADWRRKLYPQLEQFLLSAARDGSRIRLVLDAHTTLAFAAGSVLNRKSGRVVELEQRSPDRMLWSQDDAPINLQWPSWRFSAHATGRPGKDIAVAVSLTHATESRVRQFIDPENKIGALVLAELNCGASSRSVKSGAHASWLAESLASHLKSIRDSEGSSEERRIHLFIAAPNGFTFFLGQQCNLISPVTLYEFDFEAGQAASYRSSWSTPQVE
jgi:hypothetical protein